MLNVAYLANIFPSPVEPYVREEIGELRQRGVQVIAGSVTSPAEDQVFAGDEDSPDIVLRPLSAFLIAKAVWLCLRRLHQIAPIVGRILFHGTEGPIKRIKALAHTLLGACYASLLEGREIDHIHVHHGYFGSWVGMVAARLLHTTFSMTLHGSDLLLRANYLDAKLKNCSFCLTVSEYNRRYIEEHYPDIDPAKVIVRRLGVDVEVAPAYLSAPANDHPLSILAVGRLHPVKDHAFLIRACAQLKAHGVLFECSIAGDGPLRSNLESQIRKAGLEERVTLLGHVPRSQMDSLYHRADLVVLTSRSEGLPLVLMEAMAHAKIVLAPAITGIPELVIGGQTGFLYEPGSIGDFVAQILFIHSLMQAQHHSGLHPHIRSHARQLEWMRHAARVQVRHNFNRTQNLNSFADVFLQRIAPRPERIHENFVLQQI